MLMRKALKMSLLLGTILVLLALTACGVDGDYNSNKKPTISITSWEGVEEAAALDTLESLVFQQRIYWNANDDDGTIAGIAYRILDEDGNPIPTPGNSVIDETGELESVVDENGNQLLGWVVHYKPGANENIPLESNLAKKTIWSQLQYATVNFPANEDGQPADVVSSIEVVCLDNMGAISNVARKNFKTTSSVPTCILSTSRGNPDGKQVGTGLFITFSMSTTPGDPFAVPGADYYEYKVGKYVYDEDADSLDIPELIEETEWFTTDSNRILLTKDTNPALTADFDGTYPEAEQLTFTRVTAHAYNFAGVKSNESEIEFAVKEGFHPKTLIYSQKVYGLGDYHYKDYTDPSDLETYPYILKDGPIPVIYANKFFVDNEGRYSAVNSTNFKVFAKWGYAGQYGVPPTSSSGSPFFSNNPYDTELGRVLNEADNKDYYSEIVAFDIRFDDQPFDFYALSQDPDNIVTHDDGTQWLRVPKNSVWSISNGLELGNLENGMHKLEISAVDLQYEYDPTPAVFEFYLAEYVPKENRDRTLVLDASEFTESTLDYITAYTDSVYTRVLGDYPNIDFWERKPLQQNSGLSAQEYGIAYTDLLNYKNIIYREESNSNTEKLVYDHDALKLYLNNGGNLIISAAKNIKGINNSFVNQGKNIFRNFFGIRYDGNAIVALENTVTTPYIIGANPTDDASIFGNLPTLDLHVAPYSYTLNLFGALLDLSYFAEDYANLEDTQTKIIYRSKAKPVQVGVPYTPQTEEVFNQFNDLPLAIGKITPQNRCMVTSFPISFMEEADIEELFQEILND
jgi:hypothetical protein